MYYFVGINHFFRPYMKKGNDLKHFSRNNYYDFINKYITFDEDNADTAISGQLEPVSYDYDIKSLKKVLSKSNWKPK